ncbi:MAG: PAS domain S-box protein [Bdellovibrionaceae bacterium]|nr:PAS domain S-box protein [Pseudobdellovibrionaceae bacterium]MDW8190791.1 PAS domain S-box protein [Pseudobdellovibrionaceae bacterium]
MIQAKNVMNRDIILVKHNTLLDDLFKAKEIMRNGFFVVGDEERCHGIVTEAIFMQIFLKSKKTPEKKHLILYQSFFNPIQFAQENENLNNLLQKLLVSIGHLVIIINDDQKITGFVTFRDIMPYFVGESSTIIYAKEPQFNLETDLYYYEDFFEKAPFMMHSVNHEGIIQMGNEILHKVLGYPYPELIGKHIKDLYSPDNLAEAEKGIMQIFSEGYHSIVTTKMRRKNGSYVEVELISRALTNSHGRVVGTMTISRPIKIPILIDLLKKERSVS